MCFYNDVKWRREYTKSLYYMQYSNILKHNKMKSIISLLKETVTCKDYLKNIITFGETWSLTQSCLSNLISDNWQTYLSLFAYEAILSFFKADRTTSHLNSRCGQGLCIIHVEVHILFYASWYGVRHNYHPWQHAGLQRLPVAIFATLWLWPSLTMTM